MKMQLVLPCCRAVAILSGMLFVLPATAQKLPDKQEVGLYVPSAVQIDGNAGEWQNSFQAYNKGTLLWYTLANDADNVYLLVKATDPLILEKISYAGIKFTWEVSGKGKKGSASVCYPSFSSKDGGLVRKNMLAKPPEGVTDPVLIRHRADSLLNSANLLFATAAKLKVSGIDGISDFTKDPGIKVAGRLDDEHALTCEFSIPRTYFGESSKKFGYTIQLDNIFSDKVNVEVEKDGRHILRTTPGVSGGVSVPLTSRILALEFTTNVKGEYKLIEK